LKKTLRTETWGPFNGAAVFFFVLAALALTSRASSIQGAESRPRHPLVFATAARSDLEDAYLKLALRFRIYNGFFTGIGSEFGGWPDAIRADFFSENDFVHIMAFTPHIWRHHVWAARYGMQPEALARAYIESALKRNKVMKPGRFYVYVGATSRKFLKELAATDAAEEVLFKRFVDAAGHPPFEAFTRGGQPDWLNRRPLPFAKELWADDAGSENLPVMVSTRKAWLLPALEAAGYDTVLLADDAQRFFPVRLAWARGAAEQFGMRWGLLNGKNFLKWNRSGHVQCLFWLTAAVSGADFIIRNPGIHFDTDELGPGRRSLNSHGLVSVRFSDLMLRKHPRRMVSADPVAVLTERWIGVDQGDGFSWGSEHRRTDLTRAFAEVINTIWPTRNAEGRSNGLFSATPYGDRFDILTASGRRPPHLKRYKTTVLLLSAPPSAEWWKGLEQYVRAGGTLVVDASLWCGQLARLSGLKLNAGPEKLLRAVEAKVLAREGDRVTLAVNYLERGRIFFVGRSRYMHGEKIAPEFAAALQKATESRFKVTGPPVYWRPTLTESGFVCTIINSSKRTWSGEIELPAPAKGGGRIEEWISQILLNASRTASGRSTVLSKVSIPHYSARMFAVGEFKRFGNIALWCPVKANHPPAHPRQVVDGNVRTGWRSANIRHYGPAELTVDLGREESVGWIRIIFGSENDLGVYRFKVETAQREDRFVAAVDNAGSVAGALPVGNVRLKKPRKARFVKVTVLHASHFGGNRAEIREVEVYRTADGKRAKK